MDFEKEYEAVIRLGYATDTGDVTGKPLRQVAVETAARCQAADSRVRGAKSKSKRRSQSLRGEIDQVPPMYSAKKQGGRKLYELARRGEEVERKPVRVCIYEFEA